MTAPLWKRSAVEVVAALQSGDVSPREVLYDLQERIQEVDPHVNALPTRCFDRAFAHAAAIEAKPPSERGRFAGLPIPIKDSYEVAGVRTTWGSLAYADHVASRSDYMVEAIEAADGIIYAKSNTPEFEAGANTFNEVFGATLNPFDRTRSAGGSSGGAAVAVATGMAFVAQGSDFACSLRYPAAFCNVVAIRPSPGLIPQGPSALPHQVLSVIGPIARSVADAALALDGMVRFDPRDPLTRPPGVSRYLEAAREPVRPRSIAFSLDLGVTRLDAGVRRTVSEALARLPHPNIEHATPDLSACHAAFRPLRAFQFAAMRSEALRQHRDKLKPEVVWNIEQGLALTAAELASAEAARASLRRTFLDFMGRYDILVAPAAPVEPFPVGERFVGEIDGEKLANYLDWLALGYAISVTGCPAASLPCGRSASGLPVGIQIVGKPYAEADLLRSAAWLEAELGATLAEPIDPAVSA